MSCPNCGYCPACGRNNGYQTWPSYPSGPWYGSGGVTVTSGQANTVEPEQLKDFLQKSKKETK